jgi:hypothetical protein
MTGRTYRGRPIQRMDISHTRFAMNRFAAVAVLALLTVACNDATRPTGPTHQRHAGGPSLNSSTDAECVGALPPGTYQNVTVPEGETCTISNSIVTGNIKALAGSQLHAQDNTVAGSIQADKAVTVAIIGGSVGGGIGIFDSTGEPSFVEDVNIRFVTVMQDIQLVKNTGRITIFSNFLPNGNITVADNAVQLQLNITSNVVAGGNIEVLKNTGGSIFMFGNVLPTDPDGSGTGNIKIEENNASFLFFSNNGRAQNIQIFKNTGGSKQIFFNSASESIQCKENTPPFQAFGNAAPKMEGQCAVPPTES